MLKNIDCGDSLEPPQRGGSNEYHNLCFEQKYESYQNFSSENFHILVVKFSIYLNRRVFVMKIFFEGKICYQKWLKNIFDRNDFGRYVDSYAGFAKAIR